MTRRRVWAADLRPGDMIHSDGDWRRVEGVRVHPPVHPAGRRMASVRVEAPAGHSAPYRSLGYLADDLVEVLGGEDL